MKILILGSKNPWSLEGQYLKNLNKLGHEGVIFEGQNIFYHYYFKSIVNKLIYRIGLSSIHSKIKTKLFAFIGEVHYDLVIVFKGMEYSPRTIKKLKNKCDIIVNYNPDHPFQFEFKGSGNRNTLKSISLYDMYFSYSKKIVYDLKKDYFLKSAWLPFGYDDEQISNLPALKKQKEICFIGNPDHHRVTMIKLLAQENLPIALYGNFWGNYFDEKSFPSVSTHAPVYQGELYETINKYGIHLNFFRKQNENSHNMRTFEIPITGSILITPYSDEQVEFFGENTEKIIYQYRDNKEFVILAKHCLNSFEEETTSNLIAKRKEYSELKKFSYNNRAEMLLDLIKTISLN